jgi:ATP-binding cassette subfamily B multidrug efflux pump
MKSLRTLAPLFWKYRGRLFAGIIFILLTNVLAVFAPALVGEGINALKDAHDSYLAPGAEISDDSFIALPEILSKVGELTGLDEIWGGEIETKSDVHRLVVLIAILQAILYLITYLIKGIFLYYTRQTIIVNSRLMEYDLKEKIFSHYQLLDTRFYRSNDTGDLMNRISEDVSRVRMFLGPAVMYTLNLVALIVIVVGVMVSIDLKLTLYALLPLPLMSIGIYIISSRINELSDSVSASQSNLSTFVQQHISGIRVLQSYHKESQAATRFEVETDEYKEKTLKLVKVEAMFMPIIVLLVGLSTVLTVYVGGTQVMAGKLELGHIFQFIFYVNLLTWPFASVGWVTSLVQKAEASMARILVFLNTKPEISEPDENTVSASSPTNTDPGLIFSNVSYTYPDTGIEAIKDISFSLPPIQTLAITGRTGSGKSTIASLCMRLIDPTTGQIFNDCKDLKETSLKKHRNKTGYVPQDVFLFSDTIANNIGFGKKNGASLDAIKHAATLAGVASDIEGLKNGYDTILGERGVNLSGGQKQRISIARALIRNPEILILDDCLSAVDTSTEKHILNNLSSKNISRSTLIISHRISTIKHADLILVIQDGQIVERGTHSELLTSSGLYSAMNTQQETGSKDGI